MCRFHRRRLVNVSFPPSLVDGDPIVVIVTPIGPPFTAFCVNFSSPSGCAVFSPSDVCFPSYWTEPIAIVLLPHLNASALVPATCTFDYGVSGDPPSNVSLPIYPRCIQPDTNIITCTVGDPCMELGFHGAWLISTCTPPLGPFFDPCPPPSSVLIAPSMVSACTRLLLDGSASFVCGARSQVISYVWELLSVRIPVVPGEAATQELLMTPLHFNDGLMTSLVLPNGEVHCLQATAVAVSGDHSQLTIPSAQLLTYGVYQFRLSVVYLGAIGVSDVVTVQQVPDGLLAAWIPSLRLHLPKIVFADMTTDLSVEVDSVACEPIPVDAVYQYEWTIQPITQPMGLAQPSSLGVPPAAGVHAATMDVDLPPYTLWAGYSYNVVVQVTITSVLATAYPTSIPNPSIQATANSHLQRLSTGSTVVSTLSAIITVSYSRLHAEIAGGDRTWPSNIPLMLDASASVDPDFPMLLQGSFTTVWTCQPPANAPPVVLPIMSSTSLQLQLPSNWTVPMANSFVFVVTLTSVYGVRSASASVGITFSAPLPSGSPWPLVVSTRPVEITIATSDLLQVMAFAQQEQPSGALTPVSKATYTWACLTQNSVSSCTDSVWQPSASRVDFLDGQTLTIAPGTFPAGQSYLLMVTATSVSNASSTVPSGGSALTKVFTRLPPFGGTCVVSPSTGVAFVTNFTLSCYGWLAMTLDANPLAYSWSYTDTAASSAALSTRLLVEKSMWPDAQRLLPAGTLQLVATITDAKGSSISTIPIVVVVTGSSSSLSVCQTLDNFLQPGSTLSTAIATGDCQAAAALMGEIAETAVQRSCGATTTTSGAPSLGNTLLSDLLLMNCGCSTVNLQLQVLSSLIQWPCIDSVQSAAQLNSLAQCVPSPPTTTTQLQTQVVISDLAQAMLQQPLDPSCLTSQQLQLGSCALLSVYLLELDRIQIAAESLSMLVLTPANETSSSASASGTMVGIVPLTGGNLTYTALWGALQSLSLIGSILR